MKLTQFRVTNFRSINDSGWINVSKLTTLVGRNESGKSNLLLALRSLNPPEGIQPLKGIKDFPRDRRLSECKDETEVLATVWALTQDEQEELLSIFPRAEGVAGVTISRDYKGTRYIGFQALRPVGFDYAEIASRVRKIMPVLQARAEKVDDQAARASLEAATAQFEANATARIDSNSWAEAIAPVMAGVRKALASVDAELSTAAETALTELEALASELPADAAASVAARAWALQRLPVFVYLDEYPDLPGHQDVHAYLDRKAQGRATESDENFGNYILDLASHNCQIVPAKERSDEHQYH